MRRLSGFVVSAVLVTTVIGLAPSAQASGAPDRFAYHSTGLFTSWEERQRISADSYEKTNWSSAATSPEREPTNASGDTCPDTSICARGAMTDLTASAAPSSQG